MAHVVVVVLGDLGRSPRMQYHALSLSACSSVKKVTLVGYEGERCLPSIEQSSVIEEKRLCIVSKSAILEWLRKKVPLAHALYKGLHLLLSLVRVLGSLSPFSLIVVQNPPCLPTLLALLLLDLTLVKAAFRLFFLFFPSQSPPQLHAPSSPCICIDWHNLGFAMFNQPAISRKSNIDTTSRQEVAKKEEDGNMGDLGKRSSDRLLLRLARVLEHWCARNIADKHFCVSQKMKQWLESEFQVSPQVFYDRPYQSFAAVQADPSNSSAKTTENTCSSHRQELFDRLGFTKTKLFPTLTTAFSPPSSTTPSESEENTNGFPVLISSTSWTDDEDFSVLLQALLLLNASLEGLDKQQAERHKKQAREHCLLVVITGKGPNKQPFLDEVAHHSAQGLLSRIKIETPWLEPMDYPKMVRCADLGVCLHTSTSGLDLPMKVLDMLGSRVPVCAISFACLPELVHQGHNGLIFHTARELHEQVLRLLWLDEQGVELARLQKGASEIGSWDENWKTCVQPTIDGAVSSQSTLEQTSSSGSSSSSNSRRMVLVKTIDAVLSCLFLCLCALIFRVLSRYSRH